MPIGHIAHTHFPYCIKKLPDESFVVLNRDYKPLGFNTKDHLAYEQYPIAVRFARLVPATVAKLSVHGHTDTDFIFLYDDGSIPTESAANMKAYLARLEILSKLKFKDS